MHFFLTVNRLSLYIRLLKIRFVFVFTNWPTSQNGFLW